MVHGNVIGISLKFGVIYLDRLADDDALLYVESFFLSKFHSSFFLLM